MRIPRLFIKQKISEGETITLDGDASHYLVNVLRMKTGREVAVFNGDGAEYIAAIVTDHKKHAVIAVAKGRYIPRTSDLHTELAVAVSKGDRFDWVLQKSTELGVSTIIPITTERNDVQISRERMAKKQASWQKIVVSASEQCQRNVLPELRSPIPLEDYLKRCQTQMRFVLHHRSDAGLDKKAHPASVSLVVGPEGGLTEEEIALAQVYDFKPLTLGPRVLRTETAPLAALAIIQHLWGDL